MNYFAPPVRVRVLAVRALVVLPLLLLVTACGGGQGDDYADRMAEEHDGDTPEATALVMAPRMPVEAETVQYGSYTGYKATPMRPDSVLTTRGRQADDALPALVIVHEWWGLNDNIRGMARRLAGEGYRVLAVDIYEGQVATTPDQAQSLMRSVDDSRIMAHMRAAVDHLRSEHATEQIGVMGWCFGGAVTLQAALGMPEAVDAAVIYYGRLVTDRDRLDALDMPILGLFGGDDQGIPVSDVRAFEAALDELGKDAEIHVYEGAGHAFANPSGQNYVEDAARQAWDETTAFLSEHLWSD